MEDAKIVGLRGEPVADFDALVMAVNGAAQLGAPVPTPFDELASEAAVAALAVHQLLLCATAVTEAVRAEKLARAALTQFDALAAVAAKLRIRLARSNPFSEAL